MKELIESIVLNVMTAKELQGIHPLTATLKEIKASPKMDEAIKSVMRSLAISGAYKAALNLNKEPMLMYNKQEQ